MEPMGDFPLTREKRCLVRDLRAAVLADEAVAKEHAQSWEPEMKARSDFTCASRVEGANAAISAWAAVERRTVVGQELAEEEGKLHGGPASAPKGRKLCARRNPG